MAASTLTPKEPGTGFCPIFAPTPCLCSFICKVVPGPSVFPSREPSVSGNFCGRIKGVNYHFALKDGTWDFPGDAGNFGVPLE